MKKDFRSPSLHYGWHSQLKLIFSKQNKDQNYKTKTHDMTDYRTTEPRQIAGQGKERKKKKKFCCFSFFPFFPFSFLPSFSSPLFSFFLFLRLEGLKREKFWYLSHPRNLPQHAEQKHQTQTQTQS